MRHNPLSDVPEGYEFILHDGTKLKNMLELRDALLSMDDSIFYFHVSNGKNDFYNWVKDVLRDAKLASEIRPIVKKDDMAEKIKERINEIKKELTEAYKKEIHGNEAHKHHTEDHSKKDDLHAHHTKLNTQKSSHAEDKELKRIMSELEMTKEKLEKTKERDHKKIRQEKEELDYYKSIIIKEFFYGLISGIILTLILERIFMML